MFKVNTLCTNRVFWLIFTTLLLAFASTLGLAQQTMSELETVPVRVREVGGLVPVGGTIVPYREVTLSAQLPGTVLFIAGEEGDKFRRGQVLVGLDEDELLAQRRAAHAQIATAESTVRNARVQYSREKRAPRSTGMMEQFMPGAPMPPFFGGGEKSKIEQDANLYSRGIQIEQARHQLLQAQSRVQEINAKLRDTKSVAPFDGAIIKKYVNAGDTVQPGQPLIEYADLSVLQVQADVPARLTGYLRPGFLVDIELDDVAKTRTQGKVAQIFPMADPTRHTIRMKFDLPRRVPVAPGMYAEVMVSDPGAGPGVEYVVIPASAVAWRGGLPMAYVVTSDNRTEMRLLRLGDKVEANQVIVLTGLMRGERVINNPK